MFLYEIVIYFSYFSFFISRGIVFLWLGSLSDPLHKRHAVSLLESRKENNNGRVVVVEDGYEQTLSRDDRELFGNILDPASRVVAPDRCHRINRPVPSSCTDAASNQASTKSPSSSPDRCCEAISPPILYTWWIAAKPESGRG